MSRPRRNSAGFTFIESMIVLLIFGIVVIGIIPSFLSSINRARLTTAAQSISALMHSARLEAIKRGNQGSAAALSTTGTNGRVEVDFPTKTVIAYVDLDGDQTRSAGDVHLGTVTLGKDLEFHGPGPMATANAAAIWNFATLPNGGVAVFKSDGSVAVSGAIRIRDLRGNVLEVRCEPQATARVSVQKFTGDAESTDAPTDPTKWIRQDQGWSWN